MKRNFWKKTAAFTLALTLAAGAISANTAVQDLFSGVVLTAHAEVTASGFCGAETNEGGVESVTWSLEDGVLTISGTGAMEEFYDVAPWYNYRSDITEAVIESGVTSIGNRAFMNCSSITSVTIPDSVTSIGDYAFHACQNLTSVTIPDSVTSIGDYAFNMCLKLISVVMKRETPPEIGDSVFLNTSDDLKIRVPANAVDNYQTDEKWSAYKEHIVSMNTVDHGYCGASTNVGGVESVTWSLDDSGVLTISGTGDMADYDYDYDFDIGAWQGQKAPWDAYAAVITSVIIESGVTSIGEQAFKGCTKLTSVTIPDRVTSIGEQAFSSCTSLTSVTIPDSVTSIVDNAFYACTSLASVTIPDSVTSIGDKAFYDCKSLTSVTIPGSVTSIGDNAFYDCTSLTSVTIPDSVTSIGNAAFYKCAALDTVIVKGTTPPALLELVFFYTDHNIKIYVPAASVEEYKKAKNWKEYADRIESKVESGNCGAQGDNVKWELDLVTGVLTISGEGAMADYNNAEQAAPWYDYRNDITSAEIKSGVTSIGDLAFYACTSLASVTIPDSVTDINGQAFMACNNLIICAHTGTYAETFAANFGKTFESLAANFSNVSLSLTDDLALNFYAAGLNANNKDHYKVVFTGKCEEKGKDTAFTERNGLYCASANVSAVHMDEIITAKLYEKVEDEWTEIDTCTYSVNDYLENAEPEEGWSDEKKEAFDKLVDTVQLYGEVSYAYFNTPDNMPAVTDHYVDLLQGGKDYDAYSKYNTATWEDNFDTEDTDLLSLTLNSRLSMRLYLDGLAEGDEAQLRDISNNGYQLGSYTPITAKTSRFGPYYEITGISPLRMNTIREIRFNGFTYQFTPLTWCCRMKEHNVEYRDYVMADILYEYNIDAKAFSEAN